MTACKRETCPKKAVYYGYCIAHWRRHAAIGYVPAEMVWERIELLRSRGYSLQDLINRTGVSRSALCRRNIKSFRAETARRIFSIPLPEGMVDGTGYVDGLGTRRRLQALRALGHTRASIATGLGVTKQHVGYLLRQKQVTSHTAYRVDELYRRWEMTPGSSERARSHAKRMGWAPPLAWSNIDDPDETPDVGEAVVLRFPDRYREVRELESHPGNIARRLGISEKALKRMLIRYGMQEAS
jgi:AraC-like DNA-binding protein